MGESWLIETQFLAVVVQFDILLLITYLEPYPRLGTHNYKKRRQIPSTDSSNSKSSRRQIEKTVTHDAVG